MGPGTGSIEVDLAYQNVLTLISLYILVRWVYFYFYISSLGTHFGFSVHFGTLGLLLWIWTWDSLSLLCAFWYARFTSVVWSWDSLSLLCAFWYAGFTSTSIDLVLGVTLVSLYILVRWVYFYGSGLGTHFGFSVHFGTKSDDLDVCTDRGQ